MASSTFSEPAREDWEALYDALAAFVALAPWRWMDDTHVFGVENPETGEVGYCAVLGGAGEEFGLSVFLGADGYDAWRRLVEGDLAPGDRETLGALRALSALMVDRTNLESRDRAVITSLGRRFRGRNAWPYFRSTRPGFFPWYLERDEVRFLAAALTQAAVVAERFGSGVAGPSGAMFLVRRLRDGDWVDAMQLPPAPPPAPEDTESVDTTSVRWFLESQPARAGDWQVDVFLGLTPIDGAGERPYFPYVVLVVNEEGFVVGVQVVDGDATAGMKWDALLQILETAAQLPRRLLVATPRLAHLLAPFATTLGITVRVAPIPELAEAKAELLAAFS